MTLQLPQVLIDEMIAHSREDLPNECCGVIVRTSNGALELYRATNEMASPFRFNVQGQQLYHLFRKIDEDEADFLVIYHSHVASEARPSPTDLRQSVMLRGPDPWPYWVLVSLRDDEPSVRAWRIDDGEEVDGVAPTEIDISIVDAPHRCIQLETYEVEVDGEVRPRVRETEL